MGALPRLLLVCLCALFGVLLARRIATPEAPRVSRPRPERRTAALEGEALPRQPRTSDDIRSSEFAPDVLASLQRVRSMHVDTSGIARERRAAAQQRRPPAERPPPLLPSTWAEVQWLRVSGVVTSVVDGDTLLVRDDSGVPRRVRLAFIDAPEARQEAGPMAHHALMSKVAGQQVLLYVVERDKFNRDVAVVELASSHEDVNAWMLTEGHAWFYGFFAARAQPMRAQQVYNAAERYARANKLGLWSHAGPVSPRKWRLGQRDAEDVEE